MTRKPAPPSAEPLYTVKEVAALLNVHRETVKRWIADGKLAAIRLPGGDHRVRPEDLDAVARPVEPRTPTTPRG